MRQLRIVSLPRMTQSPDSPKSITAGVLLTLAGSAIYFLMPAYLGDMATAMTLGPQQMGVLGGAEIAAIAIASVFSSFWIKRVRWRRAALVGAIVTVCGDLLTCLVHSYLPILVLRVFTGLLGEGSFTHSASPCSDKRGTLTAALVLRSATQWDSGRGALGIPTAHNAAR